MIKFQREIHLDGVQRLFFIIRVIAGATGKQLAAALRVSKNVYLASAQSDSKHPVSF